MALDKIRSVRFTVDGGAPDLIANARGARPLLAAARDVSQIGRPYTISVSISAIQDQDSVKEVLTDIAENRGLSGAVRQVHVEGSSYFQDERQKRHTRREEIDLLSKNFVFDESLLTLGDNKLTLDDAAAFARMDEIYASKREELEAAHHVT